MEKIRIRPEDIREISPLLAGIMNLAFDGSCILDKDGYVVHCSDYEHLIWGRPKSESIGMHITELDSASPYPELLESGKAVLGKIHIINGLTCITHMIPLFDARDRIVGAFGVIVYRGLEKIKKLVREDFSDRRSPELYDQLSRAEAKYSINDFIGASQSRKEIVELARKAARYDYPVLIRGETGCGKEIVACGIHAQSVATAKKPFVRINCTAIPNDLLESELFGYEKGAFSGAHSTKLGKFEIAAGGTILLDEIGDLDARLQGKLLRVLEEREFERLGGNTLIPLHARIIASTNADIERLIEDGKFREDLYYRISGIEIAIPPLRERREDIMPIIRHYAGNFDAAIRFTERAEKRLVQHDWPGNGREIRNMIMKLSVLDENRPIDEPDLAPLLRKRRAAQAPGAQAAGGGSLQETERRQVLAALDQCGMNVAAAARLLGISRGGLYNKIGKYGLRVGRALKCRAGQGLAGPGD